MILSDGMREMEGCDGDGGSLKDTDGPSSLLLPMLVFVLGDFVSVDLLIVSDDSVGWGDIVVPVMDRLGADEYAEVS